MRKKFLLVIGVFLLLGYGVNGKEAIKIGMNEPLTGVYAPIGIEMVRGARMAVDEINRNGGVLGRRLELVVEDNKGEVELAIAAAERLINVHKIVAQVGPTYTYLVRAIHEIYGKAKVPLLFTATHPALTKMGNPFNFRFRAPDDVVTKAMVITAVEKLGRKRIAIAYSLEDWGIGGRDGIITHLKNLYGLEPVGAVAAHPDLRDYTGVWAELAKLDPEIVITYIHGGLPASLFLRARYELGLTNVMVLGTTAIAERVTIEMAGVEACEGIMVTGYHFMDELKVRLFEQWYRCVYGEGTTSPVAFHMYDVVHLLAKAIEKAGVIDGQAIRDALVGLEMEGVLWTYKVRENGESTFVVKIGVVRNGKPKLLEVVDAAPEFGY